MKIKTNTIIKITAAEAVKLTASNADENRDHYIIINDNIFVQYQHIEQGANPNNIDVWEDVGYLSNIINENGTALHVIAESIMQNADEKQEMFGNIAGDGSYDCTYDEMLDDVRENPRFSDPDAVAYAGNKGTEYTGSELLEILGIENQYTEFYDDQITE